MSHLEGERVTNQTEFILIRKYLYFLKLSEKLFNIYLDK